jgi:anaerobic selenocysteine-containing dehydrogenase
LFAPLQFAPVRQETTFCRICEAYCGLVADVEDGRVTKLRPDRDHPLSQGYACPKGIAMLEVHNDPERVIHPLARQADGTFARTTWDAAVQDIAQRLQAIPREQVGWYMGNPSAFSYSHSIWVKGFMDALGSRHYYTAGSQDVNNRFAASALMYDSPVTVPIPDIPRTQLLVMIGANPLVSHGSLLTTPRIREALHDIVARGGRVIAVDPRRTEIARAFEHLPVRPDTDALLLLSLLHTIFDEGLETPHRLARDVDVLRTWAAGFAPEDTEARTGVPARAARKLARDLAEADGAAVYGRTGSCLGRHGTLVAFLIDAVNTVTGNLDRPGGAVFGSPPIPLDELAGRFGLATYDTHRHHGFPEVLGSRPASLMAAEMRAGEIRAFFTSAGNPVLSIPNGDDLTDALGGLDLHVSIDLYVNETNRHADYILPATTFLERDDIPVASLSFYTTPFIQHTDAVVPAAGEAKPEWEAIELIARAIGVVPSSLAPARWAGRLGIRPSPQRLIDLLLRLSTRNRLSVDKLRKHPHGIVLGEYVKTGVLKRKVRLGPPAIGEEIERLRALAPDTEFPLQLIGLRELRSHNSWMHGVRKLAKEHTLRIHPDDAPGLADGDEVEVTSKAGSLTIPVRVTDEMMPGVVALPHGWSHPHGVNSNVLASSAPEDLEPLAGMAHLNGIGVRVSPVASAAAGRSSRLQTAP